MRWLDVVPAFCNELRRRGARPPPRHRPLGFFYVAVFKAFVDWADFSRVLAVVFSLNQNKHISALYARVTLGAERASFL